MPLLVICGHPSSGKTSMANVLMGMLKSAGKDAVIVDEPSLHLSRDKYADSRSEKEARGVLKSMVEQMVSKTKFVIFDSLNNIKGYRYELWCIARASGTRYCMCHCNTDAETSRGWNRARRDAGEPSYSDEIFEDLANRFETPERRNRWDSPLFTASPLDPEGLQAVMEDVVKVMTEVEQQRSAAAQRSSAVPLEPTCATSNPALSATNLLSEMDHATQAVVNAVTSTQADSGSSSVGGGVTVSFGQGLPILELHRQVVVSELRRHKRAFIKLATKNESSRLQDTAAAKRLFIDYLQQHIA